MLQLLVIAARNLATHRRRTLMLGTAIAGVTALLVLMMGVTNGAKATMLESATTLMSGHVNVGGFYKPSSGQSAPVVTHYEKLVDLIKSSVPEVDYVVARGRGWAKLVSETATQQVGIGAIDISHEPGFRKVIQVLSGNIDDLAQPKTILLFEDQADRLEAKVGDSLTISAQTTRGTNNTVDVRVVAIAKSVGLLSKFNVYTSQDVVRDLYQLQPDATGAVMVYLKDMQDVPKVSENLRAALRKAGYQVMEPNPQAFWMKMQGINKEEWTGQKLDVTSWEDEVSFLSWTTKLLGFVSGLLITILMLIISVGIMNTLWIAIRERTREIGTLRAIGMQRRRVLVMFMIEAVVLSIVSTSLGSLIGAAAGSWFNHLGWKVPRGAQIFLMSDTLHFLVLPSSVIVAVAIICTVASVVALIPSFLAARLKPVTAMSHVG